MGKQEIKKRETQVATEQGVGKQLEQVYTVDDNCLPSPQELEAYQRINPNIVSYLINASVKEQEHRHKMDEKKLKILANADGRIGRMNWWGMFFAFFCLIALSAVVAYALYLDKPWLAGILGGTTIVSVISLFVRKDQPEGQHRKR